MPMLLSLQGHCTPWVSGQGNKLQIRDPFNKLPLTSLCLRSILTRDTFIERVIGSPVLGPLDIECVKDGRPIAVAVGDGPPPGCRRGLR